MTLWWIAEGLVVGRNGGEVPGTLTVKFPSVGPAEAEFDRVGTEIQAVLE